MDGPYRVAIIEDDDGVREVMLAALADAGFEVIAMSHERGLSSGWRGDVIITDALSSLYRAEEVTRLLSRLRERFDCAVVLSTAHSEAKRDEALLGADAVLPKPFQLEGLVVAITRAAQEQRRRSH